MTMSLTLYVQGVFLVKVGCIFVIGMLGDVVLVGQERANTPQLQDTLAAVHDCQLILAHKLPAQLLVIQTVGGLGIFSFSGFVLAAVCAATLPAA